MAFKFKKIKDVTLPVLKIRKGVEYFLKVLSPLELGKEIPGSKMGQATICKCVNLETGEIGQVICPAIMVKELHAAYSGDSYVNLCFSLVLTPIPGKRYNAVQLAQVGDPTEDADWQAEAAVELARRRSEGPGVESDLTGDDDDMGEDTGEQAETVPAKSAPAKKTPAKQK